MENANRVQKMFFLNSAKERMTHFNISVTVKCRRDNESRTSEPCGTPAQIFNQSNCNLPLKNFAIK